MSFGKVLWKSIDGREFIIDTNKLKIETVEQLQEHISDLRKQYGYEEPKFGAGNDIITHAQVFDQSLIKKFEKYGGTMKTEELPEDLKKEVEKRTIEALCKPDPKNMN